MANDKLTRRTFLEASAIAAAGLALPALGCEAEEAAPGDEPGGGDPPIDPQAYDHAVPTAWDPASLAESPLFAVGVSSGAMKSDGALLWTHVEGAAPQRVRVWRDGAAAGEVALVHDLDAVPDGGGYVKLPVTGLAPATWYRYAFLNGERRSAIGSFRTAFPPGHLAPLVLGATTCTNLGKAPYRSLVRTAQEPIDAFVHLGDMAYQDGSRTLDEYRAVWRATLDDPGYRAVLQKAGMYITWDDHEVTNNWDPETLPIEEPGRVEIAKQAFFETLPVEDAPGQRLWRSYRWGATAEIFVLDSRSERRPSTRQSDAAVYLGAEQLAWLKQALVDSPCHFKILLNSVPMTGLPLPLWGFSNDRWQGYQHQREELLAHLEANGVRNTWFLSGDFHVGFVARVEADGPRRGTWEIAVGPGGNDGNPITLVVESDPENRELAIPARQFPFFNSKIAMTTLTFDPATDSVRVLFVDAETDEVLHDATYQAG